jgi:hypothetical protein
MKMKTDTIKDNISHTYRFSLRNKNIFRLFRPVHFSLLICTILFVSCKEEGIGQYPVDSIPPQKISNPVITNVKGGATITYDLPLDKDLLYVKATYTLPNGQVRETLASAFVNELHIRGFAKSVKLNIALTTVDRSQNESEPVLVEIEPMDSPIFDIYESLYVIASFGGIKLNWDNLENEEVLVGVIARNEEDVYVPVENFYSTVNQGDVAVRGLESKEIDFGIYVRDIYSNYTDTLFVTLTPWEESELDKSLWRAMPMCNSVAVVSQWGEAMPVLWNNIYITEGIFYLNKPSGSTENLFFTMDLGVSTKLSRFKFWGRNNYYFNLHHPKEFEVWGTNDPDVANGDACSWEGWHLLLSDTSEKPSGPDPVAFANLTSEDIALAHAGEEYEFELETPFVRYIRYRTLRTWTNSTSSFLSELSFWGQIN